MGGDPQEVLGVSCFDGNRPLFTGLPFEKPFVMNPFCFMVKT
jgi:hypothetical protein